MDVVLVSARLKPCLDGRKWRALRRESIGPHGLCKAQKKNGGSKIEPREPRTHPQKTRMGHPGACVAPTALRMWAIESQPFRAGLICGTPPALRDSRRNPRARGLRGSG